MKFNIDERPAWSGVVNTRLIEAQRSCRGCFAWLPTGAPMLKADKLRYRYQIGPCFLISDNGMVRPCSGPRVREAGKGRSRQGARHLSETQRSDRRVAAEAAPASTTISISRLCDTISLATSRVAELFPRPSGHDWPARCPLYSQERKFSDRRGRADQAKLITAE